MLKSEHGLMKVTGELPTIAADLCILFYGLVVNDMFDWEEITEILNDAKSFYEMQEKETK